MTEKETSNLILGGVGLVQTGWNAYQYFDQKKDRKRTLQLSEDRFNLEKLLTEAELDKKKKEDQWLADFRHYMSLGRGA